MFYGQNCSGRLGEKKTVICVVGSEKDLNFVKFLSELNIKHIKKELNENYFSQALKLSKKHNIIVSIVVINTPQFNEWKKRLLNYPQWFARLYGIICYKALKPVLSKKGYLQMDREYDEKTLSASVKTMLELIDNPAYEIYIRKEGEHPFNRIIIADLFARGYFKDFNCNSLIINKKLEIENEFKRIFKTR